MTFSERLNITSVSNDEFIVEKNLRSKGELNGSCSVDEFDNLSAWWKEKSGGEQSYEETLDGQIKYHRKKANWEKFEDKAWKVIVGCGMKFASCGLQVIKYGEGPKQMKQVDAILADDDFVYVVEVKQRTKKVAGGSNIKDPDIRNDVTNYRSFFRPLSDRVKQLYPDFSEKEFVFILVTQSVDLTDIKPELKIDDFGYSVTSDTLKVIEDLSSKLSTVTNSIFRSEVMRGRKLRTSQREYYALKTRWSDTTAYSFYADPSEIADRFYVHKRAPDRDVNIGMAYQRMMNPSKVSQISTYLKDTEGFFPNSIIAHCENIHFDPLDQGDVGKIRIPSEIGSIWLIDGQHRVFGSLDSRRNRKLNFCLLVGTKDEQQARLFTTINEKQTKIPLDLIWDLHGSLNSYISEPENSSEREQLRKYFISRTWKKMNNDNDSPFLGRIVIPSETKKSTHCHIKFGFLCKYLDQTSLWEQGALRTKKWKNAQNRASSNLKGYFSGIKDQMPEDWERPNTQNWLLSQYSLMVQIMVFRRAVTTVFDSYPLKQEWSNREKAKQLSYDLGKKTAQIIQSLEGYEEEIRNAGNISMRTQWMKKITRELENKNEKYRNLNHGLDMNDNEKDDADYLNPKQKDRIKATEKLYRKIVYASYTREYSDDWYDYFSPSVKDTIKKVNQTRKKMGEEGLDSPSEKFLDSTNPGELMVLIEKSDIWSQLKPHFLCSKDELKHDWARFCELRAAETHNRPIPNKETKTKLLAHLTTVYRWGEEAFTSMNQI